MAISLGRLRPDTQYDYKFVGLSHNTLRGAAGGGVLWRNCCAQKDISQKTNTQNKNGSLHQKQLPSLFLHL